MKMIQKSSLDYDTLVIGAGTAGMESSLTLGDMGYKVLVVEKTPSVGGRTILLSKVFPTLDCASCISTPKMAAVAHHPNVDLWTYSEPHEITKNDDGTFNVKVKKKPTFVDFAKCTGCAKCETVCTVAVPDEYNYDLVARRAAHIAFPQAVPKKSVIERNGSAPCIYACPAGVNPSGFVSLVRAGKYKEAYELHLKDAPLIGALSRACYAPCEGECTRSDMEGPVNIRAIKRFMVDWYYDRYPEPEYGKAEVQLGTRIAIIGAGPSGLSAAYFLAKKGHQVTIFEAQEEAGGMLRYGMPAYRMPNEIVDRDIKNITALGVEIKTNTPVESLKKLKDEGFDAVYVSIGNIMPRIVPIEGKELVGIDDCMNFLKNTKTKQLTDIQGKNVAVIGGGNVAMDVARSAIRMGTSSVSIICLEPRDKMLAHEFEVEEATQEGVTIHNSAITKRIYQSEGRSYLEYLNVNSFEIKNGKLDIQTQIGSESSIKADVVIYAVGLRAKTEIYKDDITLNPNGTITVDNKTLQTSDPSIFAGGDVVTGPSIMVKAMGQGKRAAFYIDRYLNGEDLQRLIFDERLPVVDKKAILNEAKYASDMPPLEIPIKRANERIQSFEAYEGTLTEEEARKAANRCLNCAVCSQCLQCVDACPADAIDFSMREEIVEMHVGSIVVSTGFNVIEPALKPLLGYDRFANVISSPQMDRLLAPTRPFNTVLRPSDGKEPENIAFVLCTGARDKTVCNPTCCRVGCMYTVKHAQLIMGALPLADVTIYYIDIRAFGKGYEEFYQQSKGMGVNYVKGKVSKIDELESGDLTIHYEDIAGGKGHQTAQHDMVVISVGLQPNTNVLKVFQNMDIKSDDYHYIIENDQVINPSHSTVSGVFVAGTVSEARDIPDTVIHANAAASQAAVYIEHLRSADAKELVTR